MIAYIEQWLKDNPWALEQMGLSTIPGFTQALKSSDLAAWEAVVGALAQIGPAAIPALAQILKGADPNVREAAVRALAQMGPEAVLALAQALTGTDSEARAAAAKLAELILIFLEGLEESRLPPSP